MWPVRAAIGFLFCLSVFAHPQEYALSTYAGMPEPSDLKIALFSAGITTDAAGNVYFTSNTYCACVFKLDLKGALSKLAGTSDNGYSGDGGPANHASLNFPGSIAVDASGNLYIADRGNNRIRKISADGVISTFAGDGTVGYAGNGGPAVQAQVGSVDALTVDSVGNVYIAQNYLSPVSPAHFGPQVRKVSVNGTITTVAGSDSVGDGGDGGSATAAQLLPVTGLATDSAGNLFLASWNRVRQVSADGTISTVAGGGKTGDDCTAGSSGDGEPAIDAPLCSVYAVAVDRAHNLVITELGFSYGDYTNVALRTVTPDGRIVTIASDGANLTWGGAVATDAADNVFVADGGSIRKITRDGSISAVAGFDACCYSGDGGLATNAQFNGPHGLATDAAGNLYIADLYNHRIRKISPDGTINTVAGGGNFTVGCLARSGDTGPATDAQLCSPYNIAADAAGTLLIADYYRVRKVSRDGTISVLAGRGTSGYSGDGGPATEAQLKFASGVVVDGAGNVFIRDFFRIRKVSPDGKISTVAGNGTYGDSGDGGLAINAQITAGYASMAVDFSDNLYFLDSGRVRKVSADGLIVTVPGGNKNVNAIAAGPNGNLFLSEGSRVIMVSLDGAVHTIATSDEWDGANTTNLTVDSAGNVYLVTGNIIRVLRPSPQ